MATALTIPNHYQVKYESMWRHLLQQKQNRLRNFVTVKSDCSGKVQLIDQLGLLGFDEKTSRMGATVLNEVPTEKRAIYPREFHRAYGFDEFDAGKLGEASVPLTETAQAFANAANRKMESVIIDGISGTNYEGENGTTAVALSITSPIDNTIANGSDNLTLAKLREAAALLMETEAWGQDTDGEDLAVCAVTASQIRSLLSQSTLTTSDQMEIRRMINGHGFADVYGVRLVRTQQLPKTGNIRSCYMWAKSKVVFGIWEGYRLKLSVRDDLEESIQMRAKFSCGATRLQEEAVIQIDCDESVEHST